MKGKQKNCIVCFRVFSSSGHAKCAMCRLHKKPNTCIECPSKVFSHSLRCKPCHEKYRVGLKTPRDKFTGFRQFVVRARSRKKLGELTLQGLFNIWEKQKGICPYSGVQLILPSYRKKNDKIYVASLDRIESSLPYDDNNIQFVSAAINYMKGELSHDETIQLCKLIAAEWN